jgi:hypothetical protein
LIVTEITTAAAPRRLPTVARTGGIEESVSIAEFHHVLRVHALAAADYLDATKQFFGSWGDSRKMEKVPESHVPSVSSLFQGWKTLEK